MAEKYNITTQTLLQIKDLIVNTDNQLVKLAGIHVSELSERRVKLEMPLGDVHVNHIGTAYAVSIIMLMEVAGASLIRATYGLDKYVPIIKKIEISYLKPTQKTLVCDLYMTVESSIKLILPIEERGKGNLLLPIIINDIDGEEIAKADFTFYLLPADCKI